MKRQNEDGATRVNKHEKLPGNKRVSCKYCGNQMKQKHMDHHVSHLHPEVLQQAAEELVVA